LNASVSLDDEDLNSDKRQGIRKLMEQAIRWFVEFSVSLHGALWPKNLWILC
jgi:hypothetical protein